MNNWDRSNLHFILDSDEATLAMIPVLEFTTYSELPNDDPTAESPERVVVLVDHDETFVDVATLGVIPD